MSSEPSGTLELVVCIVKNHRKVEEMLTGFLDLGIRGATVVDVKGMGQIISTQIPIFTGFKSLFPGWGADTYMILSVIDSANVDRVFKMAGEVCGDINKPGVGIAFTVPVTRVMGMAEEWK